MAALAVTVLVGCGGTDTAAADATICEATLDLAGGIGDADSADQPVRTIAANTELAEDEELAALAAELAQYPPEAFEPGERGTNTDMMAGLGVAMDLNARCEELGL